MKEDLYSQNTYYTNLMLELEKLNCRLDRVECKFDALKDELTQSVSKVKPEDFSKFLDFDKLKERSMV